MADANADKIVAGEPAVQLVAKHNTSGESGRAASSCWFLNDDTEIIEPGWLEALLDTPNGQRSASVRANIALSGGTVQQRGEFWQKLPMRVMRFDIKDAMRSVILGWRGHSANVSAVTGACLLTRRDLFWEGRRVRRGARHRKQRSRLLPQGPATWALMHLHAVCHADPPRGCDPHLLRRKFRPAAFTAQWRETFARGEPYHHLALVASGRRPRHQPRTCRNRLGLAIRRSDNDTIRKILC